MAKSAGEGIWSRFLVIRIVAGFYYVLINEGSAGVPGPGTSPSRIKLVAQLSSHVILDKFMNLFKPQFPHL